MFIFHKEHYACGSNSWYFKSKEMTIHFFDSLCNSFHWKIVKLRQRENLKLTSCLLIPNILLNLVFVYTSSQLNIGIVLGSSVFWASPQSKANLFEYPFSCCVFVWHTFIHFSPLHIYTSVPFWLIFKNSSGIYIWCLISTIY